MSTLVNNPYFEAPKLIPVITERGVFCFELAENWKVKLTDTSWLIIPQGSRSNFATVHWFLRIFISSTDPIIVLPAIIHDYLVSEFADIPPVMYREVPDAEGINFLETHPLYPTKWDWAASAKLFRHYALSFKGRTGKIKARTCYVGIRIYGFITKSR